MNAWADLAQIPNPSLYSKMCACVGGGVSGSLLNGKRNAQAIDESQFPYVLFYCIPNAISLLAGHICLSCIMTTNSSCMKSHPHFVWFDASSLWSRMLILQHPYYGKHLNLWEHWWFQIPHIWAFVTCLLLILQQVGRIVLSRLRTSLTLESQM